jgi:hypothetical protein
MDFELTINNQVQTFEQFQDVIAAIGERAAQWNNFEPHEPLKITVRKIPSNTETIGVSVADEFKVGDLFGG